MNGLRKTIRKKLGTPVINPENQPYCLCDPAVCSTQKRANEIETLLDIQQAITSHLDLSDVLQMIAEQARKLTSAKLSFLYVLEGDTLRLAAVSGSEHVSVDYHIPVDQSVAGMSVKTCQPIMIADVNQSDAPLYREVMDLFGNIGCYMTVPLIFGTQPIGVIAVADRGESVLGNDSLSVLTMLAPSAVIGIENARLYQEQQERRLEAEGRHQMAESLRVMLAILNSNRSLEEILNHIVTHVSKRLLECQATAIFALQPKDGSLVVQASNGLNPYLLNSQNLPGYSAATQAVRTHQPVKVSNARMESVDDFLLDESQAEWAMVSQLMVSFQAWLAVPLIIKGEVYGAILLYYSEPRVFPSEEINLAQMFSDQVALAIENAHLRIKAEQAAVIAERNRLARELHDAVSQTLFSANLIAEVLPRLWERDREEAQTQLNELHILTRGALAEMRTLLFELRPAAFKDSKLGDLLKHLIQGISVRSQIPIKLKLDGERMLPPDVQLALYRITQESLNNIIKHARPNQAEITLVSRSKDVRLSIYDDGCGFDPETVSPEHFGLSIMQERASSINASLTVKSHQNCGTQIDVVWLDPTPKEKE